ncbi:MAG: histidine phosphatase family protein [Sphaerochaetaceae bacterium]|nr:histidine phosphatase family protein [Sphaerochaetaceae bacterium]
MKLLVVRHGEPDYEHDSLTEKGDREASLLADMLCKLDIKAFYCSPLGRARRTASYTLERMGREAEVLDWLREFQGRCERPDRPGQESIFWDWRPQDLVGRGILFDKDKWTEAPELRGTNVVDEYRYVVSGFDALMTRHGYVRDGGLYRAVAPNNDTIVLFCHLGVQGVFVSHLLGVAPLVMLQGFAPAPTGVTTIATEERVEGIAAFRVLSYGSVDHLYAGGEAPSFAGRFCETYSNSDERH